MRLSTSQSAAVLAWLSESFVTGVPRKSVACRPRRIPRRVVNLVTVVFVSPAVSNVELGWEVPNARAFLEQLASFSRLVHFDKRGTGMSDRVVGAPTLETRMDDVRAVMDAVGSERAALVGWSEGVAMSALFAATYPERAWALVLYGGKARELRAPDYPWGPTEAEAERAIAEDRAIEPS